MLASNALTPSPLTDDTASDPVGRVSAARQIRLAVNQHQPRMCRRFAWITQPNQHVGRFDQAFGALDPDRFHPIFGKRNPAVSVSRIGTSAE